MKAGFLHNRGSPLLGDRAPNQYGTFDRYPVAPNLPIARSGHTAFAAARKAAKAGFLWCFNWCGPARVK